MQVTGREYADLLSEIFEYSKEKLDKWRAFLLPKIFYRLLL